MVKPDSSPVLELLARGETVVTRVRETSVGDKHEVVSPANLSPTAIDELYRLRLAGRVTCLERVHPLDTSEYLVSWAVHRQAAPTHSEGIR